MFVYAMRGGNYAKIGVSDDIEKRLSSFNRGSVPFEMVVICLAETTTELALEIECSILDIMPGRLQGEWLDGAVSDAEIISAFNSRTWAGPLLVNPTRDQVTKANRNTIRHRRLEACRVVVGAMEARPLRATNWHKIATDLSERGESTALMKLKKEFKAKRLAAQNRVAR